MKRVVYALLACNIVLLLAVALLFRTGALDRLPGINGDEAWEAYHTAVVTGQRWRHRKPPGRYPLNPVAIVLRCVLLAVFTPSFWLLRIPSAISGIFAIALTYVLGKRVIGGRAALLATLLLAALPLAIGYARFGWDPSHTFLFSLLALYFVLRRQIAWGVAAFCFCLLVHPTNIFLFPILIAPCLAHAYTRLAVNPEQQARFVRAMAGGVVALALLLLALSVVGPHRARLDFRLLLRPREELVFMTHLGRLFSGVTIYEYIAGPVSASARTVHDLVFWSLAGLVLLLGGRKLARDGRYDGPALIIGILAALGCLYLTGGANILKPGVERYGIFLVVPCLFAFAMCLDALFPHADPDWRSASIPIALVSAISWMLLYSVKTHYFDPLLRTGGETHLAFRTAAVEPKRQAFQIILADMRAHGGRDTSRIVTEDFWTYWPLRFLAIPHKKITFDEVNPDASDTTKQKLAWSALPSGAYLVGYEGGAFAKALQAAPPGLPLRHWIVTDYAGRPLLHIFHR